MKFKFLKAKKKSIVVCVSCLLVIFVMSVVVSIFVSAGAVASNGTTIVIDAGHGGLDVKLEHICF